MERASGYKSEQQKRIQNELLQGRELARRIRKCIKDGSFSSQESRLLVEGLVTSYSMSLSMLRSPEVPMKQVQPSPGMSLESPAGTLSGSPANESRKRCIKWTKQVTISQETGLETALDDGYSWRKYGQKEILGSKYPRGYYRCTHKSKEGCLARKQIQRTDEQDPPVFNVTYCATHTCSHQLQQLNFSSSPPPPPTPTPNHATSQLELEILSSDPTKQTDDFLRYLESIIKSSGTAHIEPMFSTMAHIFQVNQKNILGPFSSAFDATHYSSFTSSTSSAAARNIGGSYLQGGAAETEGHSAMTCTSKSSTVALSGSHHGDQQLGFSTNSGFDCWDFSTR